MADNGNLKKKIISSFGWALLERGSAQGISLIINIILARLLDTSDYGMLSIMVIFTNLANQFIQNGFSTSLIQNPNVTEDDYSSVFHVSMGASLLIYGILWISAPMIGAYYAIPDIEWPLRIMSLVLFSGTMQSVQTARLRREMDFKNLLYLTVSASLAGGICGIVLAFWGAGVWALVAQQLIGGLGACVALYLRQRWLPRCVIRWDRVRVLFSYGWKILASSLLHTLYTNLTGLIIGKKYTPTMLAFYNKGQLLPTQVINNVNDSIQSVMLSTLARQQGDRALCKQIMRRALRSGCFLVTPMMAGLAAVSEPVIILLLTEKWVACVPFMQLTCLAYIPLPIIKANLEAIKALGYSDVYLKLEVLKKIICFSTLAITVFCFDSVFAIMMGNVLTMYLEILIDAIPNQKIMGYSFYEQLQDLLPPILLSGAMFLIVTFVGQWGLPVLLQLIVQIAVGVIVYAGGAALLRLESFFYILNTARSFFKQKRTN